LLLTIALFQEGGEAKGNVGVATWQITCTLAQYLQIGRASRDVTFLFARELIAPYFCFFRRVLFFQEGERRAGGPQQRRMVDIAQ